MDSLGTSRALLDFIASCPSAYHVVDTVARRLEAAGFTRLREGARWSVERGGLYYVTRNGSSIVAFKVGSELDRYHFQMVSSHSDSPTFKVKDNPELKGPAGMLRLNTEGYGGMIDFTWLDRPLSIAGRVMVEEGCSITSHLLSVERDVLLIPSVAIHMNRQVNEGFAFNHQVDLLPLVSAGELGEGSFVALVAEELGVTPEQVVSFDLFLVNRQPGVVWGAAEEFVSSPRIDDLQGVYAALEAFLVAENPHDVSMLACFDNEEVGSGTKQGAKSTFLHDVLMRTNSELGKDAEDYLRAVASSMLLSLDNAHAVHPNHPEHSDEGNRPRINGGVVIKENASQTYTTDALSRAVFTKICRRAGVPTQAFASRSDKRSGSTLGNLSNMQVSVHAVDIGFPQLAMHSAYETAGAKDTAWGIQALQAFFESDLAIEEAERVTIG